MILIVARPHGAVVANQMSVLAGLLIGIISDILVLGAVRFSVRLIGTTARLKEILFALLVQVGALILIVVVPFELSTPLLAANKESVGAKVLLSSMLFDFFTVIGVGAFLSLLAIAILHRVFWPMLSRIVYSIARFKPLQNNRKTFAAIGVVCVLYGLGFLNWHGLIVWFTNRFAP
jgi:hypothetical protein